MLSGFDKEIGNTPSASDGKVKVDGADAGGFLKDKLVQGSNITLAVGQNSITVNGQLGRLVVTRVTSAVVNTQSGYHYVCDGVGQINLPSGTEGASIGISDIGNTFTSNPVTVTADGSDYVGRPNQSSLVLDRNMACIVLGFTNGVWVYLSAESFNDLGSSTAEGGLIGIGVEDGDKGDIVVSNSGTVWNLDTSGVVAGSYAYATITVDDKGRITSASEGATALSTVATSGSYSDLSNLPTLGTASAVNTEDITGTTIITVTVDTGKFLFDGLELTNGLLLLPGRTYRFDLSDATNATHDLRFSITSDGTHGGGVEYTTGVTATGTSGTDGIVTFIPPVDAPETLYPYCITHASMGGTTIFKTQGGGEKTAVEITVDTTNFNSNLSGTDTTVQAALETLDDLIASGGHTIQNEGTPLTQRTNLNFVGSAVTVTDDSGNDASVVSVNLPTTGSGLNLGTWDNSGSFTTGVRFDGSGDKVLLPKATTAARSAVTLLEGELVYDSDEDKFYYGDGVTVGGVVVGSGSGGGREVLTANRTYYVRTDGNDSNDGLTDTAGGAFLTIQKAVDVVSSLDISIFAVTIQLGAGTYSENVVVNSFVGKGTVTLKGDSVTPSNTIIEGGSGTCMTVQNNHGSNFMVKDVQLQSTASSGNVRQCIFVYNGVASVGNAIFGSMPGGSYSSQHIKATGNSLVKIISSYSITGGANMHILSEAQSVVDFREAEAIAPVVVTITGSPSFSDGAFWWCAGMSMFNCFAGGTGLSFSGSVTNTTRYAAYYNSLILTNGGAATFLPGTANGAPDATSIYV